MLIFDKRTDIDDAFYKVMGDNLIRPTERPHTRRIKCPQARTFRDFQRTTRRMIEIRFGVQVLTIDQYCPRPTALYTVDSLVRSLDQHHLFLRRPEHRSMPNQSVLKP